MIITMADGSTIRLFIMIEYNDCDDDNDVSGNPSFVFLSRCDWSSEPTEDKKKKVKKTCCRVSCNEHCYPEDVSMMINMLIWQQNSHDNDDMTMMMMNMMVLVLYVDVHNALFLVWQDDSSTSEKEAA